MLQCAHRVVRNLAPRWWSVSPEHAALSPTTSMAPPLPFPIPSSHSASLPFAPSFCLWGTGHSSLSGPAPSPLSLEVGKVPSAPDWLALAAKQLTSSKFTFLGRGTSFHSWREAG